MKRPILNKVQRFMLKMHRSKEYNSFIGAQLELHLAWKKLQREICKTLNYENKTRSN